MAGKGPKKFRHCLLGAPVLLSLLLFGAAWFGRQQEQGFSGSCADSLWIVLFTPIGQGEFAMAPRTASGRVIAFPLSIVGSALWRRVLRDP